MKEFRLYSEKVCNKVAMLSVDLNLEGCKIKDINKAVENKLKELIGIDDIVVDLLKNTINLSPCDYDVLLQEIVDTTEIVITVVKWETKLIWQ